MKKEAIICGAVALGLAAASMLSARPAAAQVAGVGCAVEMATVGVPGRSCATAIVTTAAPYAVATGAWVRNRRDGWTYRENLEAARKYLDPYRGSRTVRRR